MIKYTQKWCIVAFLDDNKKPEDSFLTQDWPLHTTLAAVFSVSTDEKTLIKELHSLQLPKKNTFSGGESIKWGRLTVNLLRDTGELQNLHESIAQNLSKYDFEFLEPQYAYENNKPHVTAQKTGRVKTGEKVTIKSIALIDMFPDGNHSMRRIAAKVSLVEK